MPEDLNPHGTLFGGTLMGWMDKISAMLAARIAKGHVVTAKVDEINFKAPAFSGDQIELTAYQKKLGNSSVQIYIDAFRMSIEPDGVKKTLIADSTFTFVHIGSDKKPKYIER
jgi:acyl-CoA hydrolase